MKICVKNAKIDTIYNQENAFFQCKDGHMLLYDNCVKCNSGCLKCNVNECLKCEDGLFIQDGICVNRCDSGYFKNNNLCVKCETDHCDLCSSSKVCVKCRGVKFLKSGKCVDSCGEGYFEKGFKCEKCHQEECLECDPSNPDNCLKCHKGMFIYNKKCINRCPITTFLENDNKCVDCINQCKLCENKNSCVKCKKPYALSHESDKCRLKCPKGSRKKKGKCVFCKNRNCKKCEENEEKCDECEFPRVLNDGDCLEKCPKGKYYDKDQNKCKICDFKCDQCENDSSFCLKCSFGFEAILGHCKNICLEGFRNISGKCVECNVQNCKYCSEDLNICGKCKNNYVLSIEGKCIEKCEKGTFMNSKKR